MDGHNDLIRDLADDAGEFGDWDVLASAGRVKIVQFSELPQATQTLFTKLKDERSEDLSSHNPGDWAEFGDPAFLQILDNGEVVGHVLNVWDAINHPFFDGSGLIIYVNRQNEVVADREWSA